MSEWISVNNKMPNNFSAVLVSCGGRVILVAFHEDGRWEIDGPASMPDINIVGITHWMELPEPPK